jgi:hypothetical protein
LYPPVTRKKVNAEISTPESLRKDMLDALIKYGDPDFFKKPQRVLEPCAGKGGFLVSIIDRFMDGLKDLYPDPEERYKFIVENCIYYADINPTNIFICKLILDPMDKYKLHAYQGDTLKMDIKEVWALDGFDAVIGNPPYQDSKGSSNGTLWDKFVIKSISYLTGNGLMCMVHPFGWRNVSGKFKKLQLMLRALTMKYLEIHNEKDGLKLFKAETRYDWYVVSNTTIHTNTRIIFQDQSYVDVDISKLEFIPNAAMYELMTLIGQPHDDKCVVIHSHSAYDVRKPWMSKFQRDDFTHPCVYTVNSKGIASIRFSSKRGIHFGTPKLIWSNGRIKSISCIIDNTGQYGLTEFAYAIVDDVNMLPLIKTAFDSKRFRTLMEHCAVSQLSVNHKVIAMFKKDWYKEFL